MATSSKILAHSGLLSTVTITPVIQAATYDPNDLVGGKIELLDVVKHSGGGGMIQSLVLLDKASQGRTVDVVLFGEDPDNTTFTENDPFDLDDTDVTKVVGVIRCEDKIDIGPMVGVVRDLAMPFVLPAGGTSLFAAIILRQAATYLSTSDLTLRFNILEA